MPDSKFLDEYPLYRKKNYNFPAYLSKIPIVNINMYCLKCQSIRTFKMISNYDDLHKPSYMYRENKLKEIKFIHLIYKCASCEDFERIFLMRVNEDLSYIEKIGQYPPWDISIGKNMKNILREYSDYFRKGKICESQGYGIGAYAYYRRIVEEIIDELLYSISDLMTGDEKEKYEEALAETKKIRVAKKKIELIKDLLPPILKPEQFNPLKTLHEVLSEGIHGRSDEKCLEDASIIRDILIFLVNSIIMRKKEQDEFTKGMKKILEKRKERNK